MQRSNTYSSEFQFKSSPSVVADLNFLLCGEYLAYLISSLSLLFFQIVAGVAGEDPVTGVAMVVEAAMLAAVIVVVVGFSRICF
jgi:hypothetical protein